MPKDKPDELKIKIILKVDKALYDRIVAQAKKENLSGTIEDVLKNCCYGWFQGWENIFKTMDNPEQAPAPDKPSGLVGLDGAPLKKGMVN